jgi:sigma-B regulation protein RsbU (phosphoserine phosphatase)
MAETSPRSPLLLYAALAVLCGVAVAYQIRVTESRYEELTRGESLVDFPLDIDPPSFEVEAGEDATAAGVQPGDRLTQVGTQTVRGSDDVFLPMLRARPGDHITFGFEPPPASGRPPYTASILLKPMRDGPPTTADWLVFLVGGAGLPFLCLLLGFWVAAIRIRDPLAWLLLLLLLSMAQFGSTSWRDVVGHPGWSHSFAAIYQPVFANLWPLSMMLFGIYFPDRLPFDRRHPHLKWIVIAPLLVRVLGTNVATDLFMLTDAAKAVRVEDYVGWMRPIALVLQTVAIVVFFVALGYKTIAEREPDARRRLRLLNAGAILAVTPIFVAALVIIGGGFDPSQRTVLVLMAILFVFPLTMAYVIVVERALDVRLVVRQGVRYLLARGTIRALQIGGSIAILFLAVDRVQVRGDSPLRFAPIVVGVAAIVAIGRFGDRLRRWVDRRFFREAYDAEQILAELAEQVRTIFEVQPLIETVGRQVSSAMHIPRLAILLNSDGTLRPAFALGYDGLGPLPVPPEPDSIGASPELRTALGAELVLPLAASRKLVGVMGLGPKRSEEPYTSNDVRLLDAVAAQTGLALENSRLTAEIAAEIADREKRKREMEIAREVQQRLFPQTIPAVAGLQLAGACRPALAVGGDYYDFVQLADGKLGIAIGDISGKGIPASLLMATLRAYLRSQTIQTQQDLPAMIANLNSLVYESSDSNRYATFFFGRYDPATRVLDYVNAGHNPPMIFRNWGRRSIKEGGPGEVIRLDTGGPVIGLLPAWSYQQGSVTLCPGDLFVSFTDGISEAMNGAMEEWGEEQLIATVAPACEHPLDDLIMRIMAGADMHTGTAPQHDDMTLVLARCV